MGLRCSVIVPFYNPGLFLEACLSSLVRQDFPRNDYELIFVDNGSTDSSPDLVKRHEGVILVTEKSKGAYHARNRGIEIARGEVLAFTDADCTVSSDWIASIVEGIERGRDSIVMGPRFFNRRASLALDLLERYENAKARYVIERRLTRHYFGYTNNMAASSGLFRKSGPFLGWDRAADTEWVHRCVAVTPDLSVKYLETMKVVHLEIRKAVDWFRKLMIYGATNQRVRCAAGYSLLPLSHKIEIFKTAFSEAPVNHPVRIGFAMVLLALGEAGYRWGRMTSLKSSNAHGRKVSP